MQLESISTGPIERTQDIPELVTGKVVEPQKILLPVDFSENSRRAVDYVGAIAAGSDLEITLFHAWRKIEFAQEDEELKELVDQMEENIQGWLMI